MRRGFALLAVLSLSSAISHAQSKDTLRTEILLPDVEVRGEGARRNLESLEMGRFSLSGQKISSLPVLLGEPDLIKALQVLPGVSPGVEGFTGLYVHGGDNDQNLYLLQGLPLYNVSHLGGVFSSFNVYTVSKVDFYKSAFPSKYGGRISSISDVSLKQPDFEHYHGKASIGLLGANLSATGPVIKNKLAFTAGVRRSWIDAVSVPTLAVINAAQKKNGKKTIGNYNFMDFNARLDWKISDNLSAFAIGYYGHDGLKMGSREFSNSQATSQFYDEKYNRLSWGNWGALGQLNWMKGVGMLSLSAYLSSYSSDYAQMHDFQQDMEDEQSKGYSHQHTENGITDANVKLSYLLELGNAYTLHAGIQATGHDYLPERIVSSVLYDGTASGNRNGGNHLKAGEYAFFVDNTVSPLASLSFNLGLRGVAYHVQGTTFRSLEPRFSLRLLLGQDYSLKASYTRMSQFAQQISSSYINLPTDFLQPVTARFSPLKCSQYSAGFYGNLSKQTYFSVEGWYRDLKNLLEYREGVSLMSMGIDWEQKLTSGNGWAYGLDISATTEWDRLSGTVGYGLMWNERKFPELNFGKAFPSKFDNRHKINVNMNYRLNERMELNAGWTYMTGNRLTLALYNYDVPGKDFPEAPTVGPPGYGNESDGIDYLYSKNNIRIPAYHRLDVGLSIHKMLKNGNHGTWNISLYNAYCRMNPMTVVKDNENEYWLLGDRKEWHRAFKTFSLLPLIPSVSYIYSF